MIYEMRYELPQCLAAAIRGLLGSIWLESPPPSPGGALFMGRRS